MKDAQHRQIVQRIQSGDAAAEKELFIKYKDAIHWKVCKHIKADAEHIKDVVGEVYLAMLQGLRSPNFEVEKWESLDAYIWGVTQNKIRDWFKRSKKERAVFNPLPPPEEVTSSTDEYLLELEEFQKQLRTLLKNLPPQYKEVLDLKFFQELSVQEISQQIGLPPRRVSERIHYALKLTRKAFEKGKLFSYWPS